VFVNIFYVYCFHFNIGTNAANERTDDMCAKSGGDDNVDNEKNDAEQPDVSNDDDDVENVDENNTESANDGLCCVVLFVCYCFFIRYTTG
jgi:hypothetical protein